VPIPAVAPPVDPGIPTSLPPGSKVSRLTGAIDDSAGSGIVIPLNTVDDSYVDWRMQTLDGWDSAELEEQAENKTGADGMFDAENFYGGRMVTIGGKLRAPTYEEREAAEYRLRQAVPRNRLVVIRIDETTPKYVMARRTGRLMVRPLTDVMSEWNAAFLAPDPRKYGLETVSASLAIAQPGAGLAPPWTPPILLPAREGGTDTATVTNSGDYDSQPLIRIAGPGSGMEIINLTTGATLAYTLVLGPEDYLLIDCHAGVALFNGVAPRSPAPGSSVTERFVIQRGRNKLQLVGTATDPITVATASVTFQSAWD
jgi:hypothetical protein